MTNAETTEKAVTVAEQGAHVAPETVPSKKGASKKKGAAKAKKSAKRAKATARAPKKEAKTARPRKDAAEARSNKKAEVIAMPRVRRWPKSLRPPAGRSIQSAGSSASSGAKAE